MEVVVLLKDFSKTAMPFFKIENHSKYKFSTNLNVFKLHVDLVYFITLSLTYVSFTFLFLMNFFICAYKILLS